MLSGLKYLVNWRTQADPNVLDNIGIPYTDDPCRTCSETCSDHEPYPSRFLVDNFTQMFGTVKPYYKQCIISTGKDDWEKEITDVRGTLAHELEVITSAAPKGKNTAIHRSALPSGVFNADEATQLSILNGSHRPNHSDDRVQSVLIFPDFKVVNVPSTTVGAQELWAEHLSPDGRELKLDSWILPYACVILLCSHKKRDNRCAIAAPLLADELESVLTHDGWEVHTELEDPDILGLPLQGDEGQGVRERLLEANKRRALVVKNSHMGGHKFAGNMIIYTATGSGLWYGRVTTHNVGPIVRTTLGEGRVFPALLRGGVNLCKRSVHDW